MPGNYRYDGVKLVPGQKLLPITSGDLELLQVLYTLAEKSNSTAIGNLGHSSNQPKVIVESEIGSLPIYESRTVQSIIVTNYEGYNFLHCYREPKLSFGIYLKPYQSDLWVCLIISTCFTALAVRLYVARYIPKNKTSFSAVFFFISSLFDEPYSIPLILYKIPLFRAFTTLWLFVALVLVNSYIGMSITDISSPLPSVPLHYFENVTDTGAVCRNLSVCGLAELKKLRSAMSSRKKNVQFLNKAVFAITERLKYDRCPEIKACYEYYDVLTKLLRNAMQAIGKGRISTEILRVGSLLHPQHNHVDIRRQFWIKNVSSEETQSCSKRMVIDLSEMVAAEYEFLRRRFPRREFFLGKENLTPILKVWGFLHTKGLGLDAHFRNLYATGIISKSQENGRTELLRKWYMNMTERTRIDEGSQMNLDGSIQTVFYLILAMFLGASVAFTGEKIYSGGIKWVSI